MVSQTRLLSLLSIFVENQVYHRPKGGWEPYDLVTDCQVGPLVEDGRNGIWVIEVLHECGRDLNSRSSLSPARTGVKGRNRRQLGQRKGDCGGQQIGTLVQERIKGVWVHVKPCFLLEAYLCTCFYTDYRLR